MDRRLWVARLIISDATKQKLPALHGLDWHDVNEALVGVRGLSYFWHDDAERGIRAIVSIEVSGRSCIAVCTPLLTHSATPMRWEAPTRSDTFI